MTDKEIIKALECCLSDNKNVCSCRNCPYDNVLGRCYDILTQDAIDLINRQQEEVEKLEKAILYLEDVCNSTPDKVRAEAIKEYIEKLKDLAYESDLYDRDERWVKAVTVEEIDETYKEMVGEK